MKTLSKIALILSCLTLISCSKGQQINGHNMRTALKSVKVLKERLPTETRIQFEVAFGTIRNAKKNEDQFLDTIDGKTPLEIIAIGKEMFQQQKDSDYPGYEKYASWEDMISKFMQERNTQNVQQGASTEKENARDRANDVLYKLQ
ncbi:MAG: hypothetical protein ACU84H_00280 [Gammaproteobacteria bacterium]